MVERVSWDDTWFAVAEAVAKRSECCRRQIGAVIVDPNNRIVATGYNGLPANLKKDLKFLGSDKIKFGPDFRELPAHCETDCPRASGEQTAEYSNCLSIHAEANALLFCDRSAREGGTIYVTSVPCWECSKQIANSGLKRCVTIVTEADEHREPYKSLRLMYRANIDVYVRNDWMHWYHLLANGLDE